MRGYEIFFFDFNIYEFKKFDIRCVAVVIGTPPIERLEFGFNCCFQLFSFVLKLVFLLLYSPQNA